MCIKEKFNVVILGAGAAGIAAAYALKNSGLKVLMLDESPEIGGTHINAWVNVHASTPAPPFMEDIFQKMRNNKKLWLLNADYHLIDDTKSIKYEMTLLHKSHVGKSKIDAGGWEEINIGYEPEDMRKQYWEDLIVNNKEKNIKVLLNTTFLNKGELKEKADKCVTVQSIEVRNSSGEQFAIYADVFLDCSAQSVLVRSINNKEDEDYFQGIDKNDRFKSIDGNKIIEENNTNTHNIKEALNYPTLIYRVNRSSKDKVLPSPGFQNDALAYGNPNDNIYINTVSYLNLEKDAIDILSPSIGEKNIYQSHAKRIPHHWNQIKNGKSDRLHCWDLENKGMNGIAPMLGIRETYRVLCEYMLTEKDLYLQVSSRNICTGTNLEKKIAIGNHGVDIQHLNSGTPNDGRKGIDISAINNKIHPYGVPYGCIVPKRLTNVLVASRGAGFSHIAAASFRLNKDMMQLGWAAGKASILFADDKFREKDFKCIDVDNLQKEMEFKKVVEKIESIMQ